MTDPKTAACPKCGSASIQAVPVEKKKLGNAIVAEYFLGTAAGVAASSSTVIQAICLSCGCQWFPGTDMERQIRALSGQLGKAEKITEEQRITKAAAEKKRDAVSNARAIAVMILIILAFLIWVLLKQ